MNYYVDTAADTGGDGTTTALTGTHCAFKTQAQVIAATFLPGDFVMNKAGCTWREQLIIGESGTLDLPITYTSYGTGPAPAITGANLVATWSNHSGNIWQATLATEPKVVLFDGVVGTPQANHDACTAAGHWAWESGTLYCFSTTDPDTAYVDPGIEAGTSRWLITTNYAQRNYIVIDELRLYGFDGSPAIHATHPVGWLLSNLTIEKGARTGVQMTGPVDLTIHDCTLTGIRALATGWNGMYLYAAPGESTWLPKNITIYNCDVTNWTNYGIHVYGLSATYRAENIIVHDCDLSHNTAGVYLSHSDTGTLYALTCDDNLQGPNTSGLEEYGIGMQTASNFEIYDVHCTNGRVGLEIWAYDGTSPHLGSGPSENNRVHHSEFAYNSQHGFLIYEGNASYTKFYRNWVYGNHWAGAALTDNRVASVGCLLYHNSFWGNNADSGPYADIYFGSAGAGWSFYNNAFHAVNGYAIRSGNATLAASHRHNCYYRAAGNVIDDHGTYYTLATGPTWETDGSLWTDPKFKSLSGTINLDIEDDSPCIDVAENVGDTLDYFGRPIV